MELYYDHLSYGWDVHNSFLTEKSNSCVAVFIALFLFFDGGSCSFVGQGFHCGSNGWAHTWRNYKRSVSVKADMMELKENTANEIFL